MLSYFIIAFVAFGIAALAVTLWRRVELRGEKKALAVVEDLAGMGEVVAGGRYPQIDPDRCIGSGGCVAGCPEKNVLAIVAGRAMLANPLGCVGHGVCANACPMDAITLVYGSANKAVELPQIDEHHETNQAGLYIIGELGGMGLIRNAVRQGREAIDQVVRSDRRGSGEVLDLIVVGAGPAGISATLAAMEAGLRVEMLDRGTLGGTILHYPRAKVVMTGTLDFPLYGRVRRSTMSKEELVELWEEIDRKVQLPLRPNEVVENVTRQTDATALEVHSTSGVRLAENVVLALGRRGSPRELGIPGEAQSKVAYQLLEPSEFAGQHTLVVGGGNSAVESAIALAEDGGCASVTISYRKGEFARCRGDNRTRIKALIEGGAVRALMKTNLTDVGEKDVGVRFEDEHEERIANDAVIIQIGGTPPSALLQKFGVRMIEKRGQE